MITFLLVGLALANTPATATVVKVYDGDTITLDTGDKVRVKWVNTPEKRPPEPFHAEATRLTEKLTLGRKVTLVVDGDNARDGYGRLIAGIRIGEVDLALRLIEEGFGHVFLIPPEADDPTHLLEAQDRARAAKKGIWATDRYSGAFHVSSFHADGRGNDDINVNGEYLRVCNITSGPVDTAGFAFVNLAGERFELPSLTVPAGHTVLVHSGRGEHQEDPSMQLQIFLGRGAPIWNDTHDRATLLDPTGAVVDQTTHGKPPAP